MKYELINGKIIENAPSNEKKRKSKNREIPIEIESLDDFPQILTTKYFLKIVSGKIDVINDKINFIVQHFIPYKNQLPHNFFL